VGGGLGWFYYLYHKNINETLILQNFRDDFCEELQMGNESWEAQSQSNDREYLGEVPSKFQGASAFEVE
jgi:hypothetical protein